MRNFGIEPRLVCLILLVSSCATHRKYMNSTTIESANRDLFKDCIVSEGSHRLEVREDNEFQVA